MGTDKHHCLKAFLLLLVVVTAVAILAILPWWNKLQFYDERQEVLSARLAKYHAVLAQRSKLEQALSKSEQALANNDYYFKAATTELAAAELQRRIKTLVDSTEANLVSTQNIGATTTAGVTKISVRVRLNGTLEALTKVLYELETKAPITIIDNLSMRAKKLTTGRRQNRQVKHLVDISFDLIGFMRG